MLGMTQLGITSIANSDCLDWTWLLIDRHTQIETYIARDNEAISSFQIWDTITNARHDRADRQTASHEMLKESGIEFPVYRY